MSGPIGVKHSGGGDGPLEPTWGDYCEQGSKALRDQRRALGNAMENANNEIVLAHREILRNEILQQYHNLENRWEELKKKCFDGGYDIDGLLGTEPPTRLPPRTPEDKAHRLREEADLHSQWAEADRQTAELLRNAIDMDKQTMSFVKDLTTALTMILSAWPNFLDASGNPVKDISGPEAAAIRWITGKGQDIAFQSQVAGLKDLAKQWDAAAKDELQQAAYLKGKADQLRDDATQQNPGQQL